MTRFFFHVRDDESDLSRDTEGQDAEVQRGGTGPDRDRVWRSAVGGEFLLELMHFGSGADPSPPQAIDHGVDFGIAQHRLAEHEKAIPRADRHPARAGWQRTRIHNAPEFIRRSFAGA